MSLINKCSGNAKTLLNFALNVRHCSSATNHYDIVIAGGGMVGTTLACSLGKNSKLSNKRVLLLEASKPTAYELTEKYSNRVVAINPSSQKLMDRINAWTHISAARYGTVKKLQVWDALSDAMITFNNDNMEDVVAYIVENDLLIDSVLKETQQLSNVTIINEAAINECHLKCQPTDKVTVTLGNGISYSCDLLLGCDGNNSKVREAMGVQNLTWKYDQCGLVATLNLSEETDNFVAWQRFIPTGPIAFLPLKENLSSLVWTTTPEEAKRLLALTEAEFTDAINDAVWKDYKHEGIVTEAAKVFDGVLKMLNIPSNAVRQLPPSVTGIVEGSRAAFPLGFGHASNYVQPGVALLGDAAHRVHPLAGLGVNLGFADVSALDKILGEAVYRGNKIGDFADLKEYESQQQFHNVPAMFAIDGIQKLYNTTFTPVVLLRSLGLQFTHSLEPLKKLILSRASA